MKAMTLPEALDVIHRQRRDAVVITTVGSARDWQQFEPHPKDLVYMPSSMGQGPPLGLGIAMAQPDQRVIVVNGDGCLLMNLGCLVTITAHEFDDVESWRYEHEIMHDDGPICIVLKTTNRTEDVSARSPGPAPQRMQSLRLALAD